MTPIGSVDLRVLVRDPLLTRYHPAMTNTTGPTPAKESSDVSATRQLQNLNGLTRSRDNRSTSCASSASQDLPEMSSLPIAEAQHEVFEMRLAEPGPVPEYPDELWGA
mmetsp:Transcript_28225/g.51981  ORF Transcript_28225/g.51981 Transcript_28225/m.51981 type:complete len:108 (-) Transcript_28225:238-561(-)